MADLLQFYPTPESLASKAFGLFQKRIKRLLEPSAGRGDLLAAVKEYHRERVDCIELNLEHQPSLRQKGYRVVGHDFLSYDAPAIYSHILMNPPFAQGVEHVLHAWNLLLDGELVAIINAESIKNAYSEKRKHLVNLIEQHGSVEYVQSAFEDPDTLRKTAVEVALVYLRKTDTAPYDFLSDLRKDVEPEMVAQSPNEVLAPGSFVAKVVTDFNIAVEAARRAVWENARAGHYARALGTSLSNDMDDVSRDPGYEGIADSFNTWYLKLKSCAWTTVLRSADITKHLSSAAQQRLEADFEAVSELAFTTENIYAFIGGLIRQRAQIQGDMVCDVFDLFSRYHDKNTVYYRGWKSNTRHRIDAFQLKATRIILPGTSGESWSTSVGYRNIATLADIDKVFAMLDGQAVESIFGLAQAGADCYGALCRGERIETAYFDLRYYPQAGTFHLFPRRKDLIDTLNRYVGKRRQWIPNVDEAACEAFWAQYRKADKVAAKTRFSWDDRAHWKMKYGTEREQAQIGEALQTAHSEALASLGLSDEFHPRLDRESDAGSPALAALPLMEQAASHAA